MSISKVNFSSAGVPITAADYTALEKSILSLVSGFDGVILTAWDDKTTTPKITQSVYIRHAGNTYQVTGSDETITGTLSAGNNYVKLTGTGSTLTASYVTSLSGYTFNPVYNGWYNGSDQILTEFVVLDGSDIINTKLISRYEFTNNIDQDGVLQDLIITDLDVGNDLTVGGTNTTGYDIVFGTVTAGSNILLFNDSEKILINTSSYTEMRAFLQPFSGVATVSFDMKISSSSYIAYGRVFVDDVAVGTERSNGTTSYVSFSENINFGSSLGSRIQLKCKNSGSGNVYIENFRIKITESTSGISKYLFSQIFEVE